MYHRGGGHPNQSTRPVNSGIPQVAPGANQGIPGMPQFGNQQQFQQNYPKQTNHTLQNQQVNYHPQHPHLQPFPPHPQHPQHPQYPQQPPQQYNQVNQFNQVPNRSRPAPINTINTTPQSPPRHVGHAIHGIGSPKSPEAPQNPVQTRRREAEKLVADCYSKQIVENGKTVPDVSYQTHIAIKEFSSFPTLPPPENLPLAQVGSIKPRVLVICMRSSGRVLIQKGKYNDAKSMYQIGRTWDMEELKGITKVGEFGLILSLNKDYYWRVDEGHERIWKFSRFLTNVYGTFMGRYPVLTGFTLHDFKLPLVPVKKANGNDTILNQPTLDPQLAKSRSLKEKNMKVPLLPVPQVPQMQHAPVILAIPIVPFSQTQPAPPILAAQKHAQAQDLYKDMDFTANGKLPMKPMTIISDRRGSEKGGDRGDSFNRSSDVSSTDSHSFVFGEKKKSQRSLDEHGNLDDKPRDRTLQTTRTLFDPRLSHLSLSRIQDPRLSQHSQPRLQSPVVFQPSEKPGLQKSSSRSAASSATSLDPSVSVNPSGVASSMLLTIATPPVRTSAEIIQEFSDSLPQPKIQPDFGIEEITDESEAEEFKTEHKISIKKRSSKPRLLSPEILAESTAFHTSMQEIEDLLDSQLKPRTEVSLEDTSFGAPAEASFEESIVDKSIGESKDDEPALNITRNYAKVTLEKDPEIEEMLDDIHWNYTDTSEIIVKKLNAELTRVKQRNVKELINLDFSKKNVVSADMKVSMAEIDNLTRVFKKMELDFKFLSTDIHEIENNSQGIQVKSINKKLLYDDLKDILAKVNVKGDDLQYIENFSEFDRLLKLEILELKLRGLADALETTRHDNEGDNLSNMKALQQYQANYEQVTGKFIHHFSLFIKEQLNITIRQLSANLAGFRALLLFRELSELLIYSGVMYFIKEVGQGQYEDLNHYFSVTIGEFFEQLIREQLRHVKYSQVQELTPDSPSLKKSRTMRLTRKMSKIGDDDQQRQQHLESVKKYAGVNAQNEIDDPRVVIEIIDETKDLVLLIQYFTGSFFHFDNRAASYNDYMKLFPYKHRRQLLDELPSMQIEKLSLETTYSSNELISNMTSIFGSFINTTLKSINPSDLNLPLILIYLETMVSEQLKTPNHEYLVFNYLKKSIEKFKNNWNKFIKIQVDALNKSLINAKCGVLPSIKHVNQLILITESSLEHNRNIEGTGVREMIDGSYKLITESLIHLFMRDDPLLKSHDFDDKEREYRNVSILQNIFYIVEQLSQFSTPLTIKMKLQLQSVFNKVKEVYFQRQLNKTIGKLVEFVTNYEALAKTGKPKKYNKKYMKSLLGNYTSKDISLKAQEIHKRFEKHFLTGGDMFEKDLMDKLWLDMEREYVDYFGRLGAILRGNSDVDVEYGISKGELHSIFASAR